MIYLSNVNRRKIFQNKWLIIAFAVFTISTLFILKNEKDNYLLSARIEISDGTEYRYLLENEIVDENRVKEALGKYKNKIFPQDFKYVDIKDYFLMKNITQIYGMDLNNQEKSFFHMREEIMKAQNANLSSQKIDSLVMGYAEGWKIVIENFHIQLYVLLVLLMLIFLPVYNEDHTYKINELICSTEFGTYKLNKIRIGNIYEIIAEIYFLGMAIYLFLIFMIYGIEGYLLPIQNSPQYFLSSVNMNYLTVFMYQLICGFIVSCFIGNIFLWISRFIKDVKLGYAIVMAIVVFDYGLRYFMLSIGFNYISIFSPISTVNAENILLFTEKIISISTIAFRPFAFLFPTFISTIILSRYKSYI